MRNCIKNLLLVVFLCLPLWLSGQSHVLTKPFKYLTPTLQTSVKPDNRKSALAWKVYTDRQTVEVYSDSSRTKLLTNSPGFMEEFLVLEESADMLKLGIDSGLDSLLLSDNASILGWVNKAQLVLWDRFLVNDYGTQLLVVSDKDFTNNSGDILPSSFGAEPEEQASFFLFNVVKVDQDQNVLIGFRTFDHTAKNRFCWIGKEDVRVLESREGIIPNEDYMSIPGQEPTVFTEQLTPKIIYSSADSAAGFFRVDSDSPEFSRYQSLEGETVYIRASDIGAGLVDAILLSQDEWRSIKIVIEELSQSTDPEDMVKRWQELFAEAYMSLNSANDLKKLFSQLIKLNLLDSDSPSGSPLRELPFIKPNHFKIIMEDLKRSRDEVMAYAITRPAFSPFEFPHLWVPIDLLPMNMLEFDFSYNSRVEAKLQEEMWIPDPNWEPDSVFEVYSSFDIFYVINNHPQVTYEIKNDFVRKFYLSAEQLNTSENSRGVVFYSHLKEPLIGENLQFVENVARQMRELKSPTPNTYYDVLLLRNYLYRSNVSITRQLKFHVFCHSGYLVDQSMAAYKVLEQFVAEYKLETGAPSCLIQFYVIDENKQARAAIDRLNKSNNSSIVYQIHEDSN